MPYLSKNDIEYITKNITPEETQYVTDIASTIYDAKQGNSQLNGKEDDIIFLTKILAFNMKISMLSNIVSNTAQTNQYKSELCDMKYIMEDYTRQLMENIQSIIGVIEKSCLTKVELPVSDNILEILNELKICIHNWYKLHEDNIEYLGCRSIIGVFLQYIHKWIYTMRLYKEPLPSCVDMENKAPNYEYTSYSNMNCTPNANVVDYPIPDLSQYYE